MDYASSKSKENEWYQRHGKTPPEVNLHLTEDERERLRKQALEGHICDYFQMGNRIICQAGENEHGRIIATNKMLVRTENNVPILTDFVISS